MKISFDFGGFRSQYVYDEKTGKLGHHIIKDAPTDKGEFVINVDETDPAELARYEKFIDENQERYLDLLTKEMIAHARAHTDGAKEGRAHAKRFYELHQKFEKTTVTVNFGMHFARFVEVIARTKDMNDNTLRRVSFGFGDARSQYVVEQGSDEHKKHYVIVGEPPDFGEFVIEVDETRPEKIAEYAKFVFANQDLYRNLFINEMWAHTQAHLNGAEPSKDLARRLFYMNCNFMTTEKSEFEEFFAEQVEAMKKGR